MYKLYTNSVKVFYRVRKVNIKSQEKEYHLLLNVLL